jgi:hypothetical protein
MLHKLLGLRLFGTSFVKLVNFTHFSEEVQRLVTLHGTRSASLLRALLLCLKLRQLEKNIF